MTVRELIEELERILEEENPVYVKYDGMILHLNSVDFIEDLSGSPDYPNNEGEVYLLCDN